MAESTTTGLPSTPGICEETNRVFISSGEVNYYSTLTTS